MKRALIDTPTEGARTLKDTNKPCTSQDTHTKKRLGQGKGGGGVKRLANQRRPEIGRGELCVTKTIPMPFALPVQVWRTRARLAPGHAVPPLRPPFGPPRPPGTCCTRGTNHQQKQASSEEHALASEGSWKGQGRGLPCPESPPFCVPERHYVVLGFALPSCVRSGTACHDRSVSNGVWYGGGHQQICCL